MFWLFRQKIDKSNRAPIYIRLTIDGMEKDMSSGRKVEPKHWDEKTKRDRGDTQEARENNKKIDEIRRNLELHFDVLRSQYEVVTPTMLKNSFLGKPAEWSDEKEKKEKGAKRTLLAAADAFLEEMQRKVDLKHLKKSTKTTWETSRKHLGDFVGRRSKDKDISLESVNKVFANDFIKYLTIEKDEPLQPISAVKKITHLKAFVEYAHSNEWTENDRLANFSYTVPAKKVKPLEFDQVMQIYQKEMPNKRLETVRDLFIFQCFTGFAYIDFKNLTRDDLQDYGEEGGRWIIRDREKTEGGEIITILPVVEEILEKYKDNRLVKSRNVLMPVISNQKYNGYLKEVGTICNLNRSLNTHLARHTFGHIMLNICFLPLEDVGRMMGHSSLRSTANYCQVGRERIKKSMGLAKEKLSAISAGVF